MRLSPGVVRIENDFTKITVSLAIPFNDERNAQYARIKGEATL